MVMTKEVAETVALSALAFLAQQDDVFGEFLALTGADAREVAARAQDAEFLGAVLDFLLSDDARVLAFARSASLDPAVPMQARSVLPGGAAPDWT